MVSDPAPAPSFEWNDHWFQGCTPAEVVAWRGVESQSQSATWRLVDSSAEHDALEAMLEDSKPPLPEGCEGLHYLLFTPFRYTSPYASRFRRPYEAGVWYGAAAVETVCAELAYWRHRFILDSAGLAKDDSELLTQHTIFQARIRGRSMDLTEMPWVAGRAQWTDGADYRSTQAVAAQARAQGVEWIRYESVRCPGTHCAAVLRPQALRTAPPHHLQNWACRATRARVIVAHPDSGTTFSWDF